MLENYYRINQAAGIAVQLLPDGQARISACGISVNEEQLVIEKKLPDLNTADQLQTHFPAGTLVALNLYGKGILIKQVATGDATQSDFLQILPNADPADFYQQHFISGGQTFIAVIRKTEADKWLEQISAQGLIPLLLSLGPFPVQSILPQLNQYDPQLSFDGHHIGRNEAEEWLTYRYDATVKNQFPLKIESETLDEQLVLPYAAAFGLVLADRLEPVRANIPELEAARLQLLKKKKLQVLSVAVLLLFLVLLLINFIMFTATRRENARLTDQVSRSARSDQDAQGISSRVKDQEEILKELGWEEGIQKARLTDRICALLPEGISLYDFAIDPVDLESGRLQHSLQFTGRQLRAAGYSASILPVNEWMARIKALKKIRNVQLDSYNYNQELKTGQFIILIDY